MTPDITMNELFSFANKLADASANVIRKYYRNVNGFETKGDASPVTIADKEVEKYLRKLIAKHYPDHGIIGEEFESVNTESDYQWVLDPVDGTMSFIVGRPLFTTLIGLCYKNKPVLGVIDQPIIRDRWAGIIKEFTSLNGNMVQTTKIRKPQHAIIATTAPEYLTSKGKKYFNQLAKQAKYTIYGGDAYNYGLLASGYIHAVIETGLKLHDFCALAAVVRGAGGVITDFEGKELTQFSDGNVIAACSKTLHKAILELV